jgi:glycosyltransferase involved in cell wall biosynthesis
MRVLFLSHNPLLRSLGAPKVLIEIADALSELGWKSELKQPSDFGMPSLPLIESPQLELMSRFRAYLKQHAQEYDVVEYDHGYLPFPRSDFPARPLFVARSVLLIQHLASIQIPLSNRPRAIISRVLKGSRRRKEERRWIERANLTMHNADLVNVSNAHDKRELIRQGIEAGKIFVAPFGMEAKRRELFDSVSADVPASPLVGFVGSFDYRKGAREFGRIAEAVIAAIPQARFRLVGTDGLHRGVEQVKSFFPAAVRSRIEVIPRFEPDQLPSLLGAVSVGVFPSHLEGFGFGVLEMLAAAIPVIAYDAPGPPEMLPPDRLVPPGDHSAMSAKIVALLRNRTELAAARIQARESSKRFRWDSVARQTADAYNAAIRNRSTGLSPASPIRA